MSNEYYDLDAILADHQKSPAHFLVDAKGLGVLAGSQEDRDATNDLEAGAKLDLPLWLGEMLASFAYVEMNMPPAFSTRVKNALKADAKSVNVRALNTSFYRFAARVTELFGDEELSALLIGTLRERGRAVADQANNPRSVGDGADFLRGLDDTERRRESLLLLV